MNEIATRISSICRGGIYTHTDSRSRCCWNVSVSRFQYPLEPRLCWNHELHRPRWSTRSRWCVASFFLLRAVTGVVVLVKVHNVREVVREWDRCGSLCTHTKDEVRNPKEELIAVLPGVDVHVNVDVDVAETDNAHY